MKYFLFVFAVLSLLFLVAHNQGGKTILDLADTYNLQGENTFFVKETAVGDGSCSSWANACLFKTAVGLCSDADQDVIKLGPGNHDTGPDAAGTILTAKNVSIQGSGCRHSYASKIYNSAAAVTYVLQVTGHRTCLENIRFTQDGELDEDVTYLYINGANRTIVKDCQFRSGGLAAADVGIELTGGVDFTYFEHIHFNDFHTVAFKTNNAQYIEARELHIEGSAGTGIHLTHADDDSFHFHDIELTGNALGIEVDANVENVTFNIILFTNNTVNVDDDGVFNLIYYSNVTFGYPVVSTYPAGNGVVVTDGGGGAGVYTPGARADILPINTITEPFIVTGINVQAATASNTYKLVLYWDSVDGQANTFGTFEFTTGAAFQGVFSAPVLELSTKAIPANAYIGATLASKDGTNETATITISLHQI